MKKVIVFIILSFLVLSCSEQNSNSTPPEKVNEGLVLKQETSVHDYNGTGVNFLIKPQERTTKSASGEFTYLITASSDYSDDTMDFKLVQQFDKDGNFSVEHYVGDDKIAVLNYTEEGRLYKMDMEENISPKAAGGFYGCVQGEYNKMMKQIESDWLNDITCSAIGFACEAMVGFSAVFICVERANGHEFPRN
ncbi:hypothetical protein [Dysgonomonas sp. 25]|uniref:hypothetical protein n=1 Tax=Dysgonomonas sp. 25 TaxID=2302933 RepID=UPI0013D298D5|nr:hypothetical protein [Dysgonomonas sp. 25]NDV69800.1 hypothetical protein [Dysgonomonas sp. 25]